MQNLNWQVSDSYLASDGEIWTILSIAKYWILAACFIKFGKQESFNFDGSGRSQVDLNLTERTKQQTN